MLGTKWILHFWVTIVVLIAVCEARGGRRGGSMGGIFGSWRKYKKPSISSSSSSRRVSSSPVHTPLTKALNEKKAAASDKFAKNSKGYNKYNTPPLPAGGSYYTNTAAMPPNAIYVAQAPPRGSEFGDFLTGYLTARLMTMSLFPHPYHQQITHVYHDAPNQVDNQNSSAKVIIVNNNPNATSSSTMTSITSTPSNVDSTTLPNESSSAPYALALTSTTPPKPDNTPPPNGIICIPLKVNEKNASGVDVQVERIVCYPAPEPAKHIQNEMKAKPIEIAGDIVEH